MVAINFTVLPRTTVERVLEYRNHPEIRQWMKNRDVIKLQDHLDFVEKLNFYQHDRYWLVREDNKAIDLGVVYLSEITEVDAEFGIYANPLRMGNGTGTRLANLDLHIAFQRLRLQTLRLKVLPQNSRAIRLYGQLGFETTKTQDGLIHMALTSHSYFANAFSINESTSELIR